MNVKPDYTIKGRNIAAMSFGHTALDSLPAWQYVRRMLYFLAFQCTPACTWHGGQRHPRCSPARAGTQAMAILGQLAPKTVLSRGNMVASRLSLLCQHHSRPCQSGATSQPIAPAQLCLGKWQRALLLSERDCVHAAPAQALGTSGRCKPALS